MAGNLSVGLKLSANGGQQVQAELQGVAAGLDKVQGAADRAAAAQGRAAAQAKMTGQQAAQMSAQLQDLFIQIQAGGNPMTALLQQGSHLSAVFGGTGNAVRAVTSLITPQVAAYGGLAAAIGIVTGAYLSGQGESQAYNRAIIMSGNAAGVTAGQLSTLAARLDDVAGTEGRAAEVLADLAAKGRVGAESLERFALAAINMERAGGQAAEETSKAFADLAKDPLNASLRLADSMGHLSAATYEQIKALTDQGRHVEAARLAQDAYATALEDRAPKMAAQLGYIERGWLGIKSAAAEAWDAMKNIGRDGGLDEVLAKAERDLEARRQAAGSIYANANTRAKLAEQEALVARLRESVDLQRQTAKAQAEGVERQRAAAEWDKVRAPYLSDAVRMANELSAAEAAGLAAGKSRKDIEEQLAAIRAKYDKKGEGARNEAAREAERAAQKEAELLERLAGLSGSYYADLRARFALYQSGKLTLEDYQKAVADLTAAQPAQQKAAREAAQVAKEEGEAWGRALAEYQKWLDKLEEGAKQADEQLQALRDEAKAAELAARRNIGLAEALQQVAIARLQDKRDKSASDQEIAALDREIAALDREIAKRRELAAELAKKETREGKQKADEKALRELDAFLDPAKAQSFGDALREALGSAGDAMQGLVGALTDYGRKEAEIAKMRVALNAETDPIKRKQKELQLNEIAARQQVAGYAQIAGAAKGFFKEGSKGYLALQAAESAFTIAQIAGSMARTQVAAVEGVVNQAKGDPYTAFARMAGMAAAMAALGVAVGGLVSGGGSTGGDGGKQATGQGTVFGDAESKSESIANTIDLLADNSAVELQTQAAMLASLRSIEAAIGGVTNQVLRAGVGKDAAERFGINAGTSLPGWATNVAAGGLMFGAGGAITATLNKLDQFITGGKVANALFGQKVKVTGSGLYAGPQDLASIMGGGLALQDYADVNTSKKFFGVKYSNKNSTQYQAADPALAQQFTLILREFTEGVKLAAGPLGAELDAVTQRLSGFVLDVGKIDLQGLSGEQIQEKLAAIFGAAGDSIAAAALPGFEAWQKVGEGYFETVVRVAAGVETAELALERLGVQAVDFNTITRKQGDVAAEVIRASITAAETAGGVLSSVGAIVQSLDGDAASLADTYASLRDVRDVLGQMGVSGDALTPALIRGAGGLDALGSAVTDYMEGFYSQTELTQIRLEALGETFEGLTGQTLPASREAFRAYVGTIDTSTEAGQKLLGQVLQLGQAFAALVPAVKSAEQVAKEAAERAKAVAQERAGLETQLLTLLGRTDALRQRERAALDETNRALYDQVQALRDLKAQLDELRTAADKAMAGLEASVRKAQDDARAAYEQADEALQAKEKEARARYDAITKQLDAERKAAKAIFDAQVSAIRTALDALDSKGKAQAKKYADDAKALQGQRDASVTAFKLAAAALDDTIKAQQTTVQRLRGLNDALQGTLRGLRPMGSEGEDRARAQRQIAQALAVARAGGVLPDADSLKDALAIVSRPSEDLFGSFEDYARDFYRTAVDIRDLGDIAGEQLGQAETELQAAIATRDTLQRNHEEALARWDAMKEALDLANDQAREAIEAQRESLQAQLDILRTAYEGKLADIDGRGDAAKEALDADLEAIAGQREQLKAELERQLEALGNLLDVARLQYEQLVGINSGIKTIPEAMAGLKAAMEALGKAQQTNPLPQPNTPPPATPAPTGQWVNAGPVQTWTDAAGAVATMVPGQAAEQAVVVGTNGATFTVADAQQFVGANVTNPAALAQASQQTGIGGASVDAMMGYTAGTFDALANGGAVKAATGSYSAAEIRAYVLAMLEQDKPRAIYDRAKAEGITMATLDAIMGWDAGTSKKWAEANNLPAFAAGGMHSGGLRLVGEEGPELEVTGPARIYSAAQTRALLQGGTGGNEGAIVAELQRLQRELAQLRTETRAQQQAIAINTGKTARLQERWDGDGLPETRDVSATA